jgi:hypothetical protein
MTPPGAASIAAAAIVDRIETTPARPRGSLIVFHLQVFLGRRRGPMQVNASWRGEIIGAIRLPLQ